MSIACQLQEWDMATILFDSKCQVDLPDKNGNTPLMKAIQAKNNRMPLFGKALANQFVSYGCDIFRYNSEKRSCFHYLAMSQCSDQESVFNALLSSKKRPKDKVSIQDLGDKDKLTALHLSVLAGNLEVCKALIANGASVNLKDSKGRTALMLSCSSGNEDICKAILEANPELHHADSKGRLIFNEA